MNTTKAIIKQGWLRALIYILLTFVIMFFFDLLTRMAMIRLSGDPKIIADGGIQSFIILYSGSAAGVLVFTWFFRNYIDRETFSSLGFEWRGYANDAWLGFFSGTTVLGTGSLILVSFGYLVFTGIEWNTSALLLELAAMIIVAFTEETIFRGYVLNNLLQSVNKWTALGISAILFVLVHGANPGVTVLALVNILAAGILLGINYIYTRNLWFSIFFHFSWNFFQGPVFGYDVSGLPLQSIFKQSLGGPELLTGGVFGFEGSLVCILLIVVLTFILFYVFRRRDLAVVAETGIPAKK